MYMRGINNHIVTLQTFLRNMCFSFPLIFPAYCSLKFRWRVLFNNFLVIFLGEINTDIHFLTNSCFPSTLHLFKQLTEEFKLFLNPFGKFYKQFSRQQQSIYEQINYNSFERRNQVLYRPQPVIKVPICEQIQNYTPQTQFSHFRVLEILRHVEWRTKQ